MFETCCFEASSLAIFFIMKPEETSLWKSEHDCKHAHLHLLQLDGTVNR